MKRLLSSSLVRLSPSVKSALGSGRAVVALESTVVTHGLPRPDNLHTATAMEDAVRAHGAVPATIALLDGIVRIGLSRAELEELASAPAAVKVSERDIGVTLAKGLVGGTTVAATSVIAAAAGIRVFATGGIGGVHRGAEESWDVSADLGALSRCPLALVCAGAKSILDVPKTLEYLLLKETVGVPVITFGDNDAFPGFFVRDSGRSSATHSASLDEIAAAIHMRRELGLRQGTLVACPIPEAAAADGARVEAAMATAVQEAREAGVKSRDVTPFILDRVRKLTTGASLAANKALLLNNAAIGGRLACLLSPFKADASVRVGSSESSASVPEVDSAPSDVVVVGGSNLDVYLNVSDGSFRVDGGSYVGSSESAAGGVGRNTADALARLGTPALLLSASGDDAQGRALRELCGHMDLRGLQAFPGRPTPTYTALVHQGDVKVGVQSGMDTLECLGRLEGWEEDIAEAKLLFVDGNVSPQTIDAACDLAAKSGLPVWFDPADQSKVRKLFEAEAYERISHLSPNLNEFHQLLQCLGKAPRQDFHSFSAEDFVGWLHGHRDLFQHLSLLLVTLGPRGVAVLRRTERGDLEGDAVPAPDPSHIVSVSGAGDCLNAGVIHGLVQGLDWEEGLELGRRAAKAALESHSTVPHNLSQALNVSA